MKFTPKIRAYVPPPTAIWEKAVLQKYRTVADVEAYLARVQYLSDRSTSFGSIRHARTKIKFLRELRAHLAQSPARDVSLPSRDPAGTQTHPKHCQRHQPGAEIPTPDASPNSGSLVSESARHEIPPKLANDLNTPASGYPLP